MLRQYAKRIGYACFLVIAGLVSAESIAEKYRFGYFEAGPFPPYTKSRVATMKVLEEMGWGDKIEFVPDAEFSPGWKNKQQWPIDAQKLMARKDLDLIFVGGTAATAAMLKTNNGTTPILSIGVSDAVKSKFVIDEEDSGVDNFWVRIIPGRYLRMFRIFHDEVGFKKLGLLYADTEDGRRYCSVGDAYAVAKERGFEIVEHKINESRTPEECMAGLEDLVKQGMDAFFMATLTCFDWDKWDAAKHLRYLEKNQIPTFARQGSEDVQAGALMGFSTIDFSNRGRFVADKIIKILQGEKPRSLQMADYAPPMIAINLEVARAVGVDFSFELLGASDEIYQEIVLPEKRLVK